MDFATRFHLLRTEKGLSQREIAKALDSKHTTVASWEQGVSRPGINMLVKVANFFDVSVDFLLGLTDIKRPNAKYYYSGAELRKKGLMSIAEKSDLEDDDFIKFKQIMAAEQITPDLLKKLLPIIREMKEALSESERK